MAVRSSVAAADNQQPQRRISCQSQTIDNCDIRRPFCGLTAVGAAHTPAPYAALQPTPRSTVVDADTATFGPWPPCPPWPPLQAKVKKNSGALCWVIYTPPLRSNFFLLSHHKGWPSWPSWPTRERLPIRRTVALLRAISLQYPSPRFLRPSTLYAASLLSSSCATVQRAPHHHSGTHPQHAPNTRTPTSCAAV